MIKIEHEQNELRIEEQLSGTSLESVAELLEHPNVAEGPEARCAYQREGWERGAARFPLHHSGQKLFRRDLIERRWVWHRS